jgi:RNA polymerase-binding transcription factor DksA
MLSGTLTRLREIEQDFAFCEDCCTRVPLPSKRQKAQKTAQLCGFLLFIIGFLFK